MKDIEGKELDLGDEVISVGKYGTNDLVKYKVIGFTPKGVRLLNADPNCSNYRKNKLSLYPSIDVYKINKDVNS